MFSSNDDVVDLARLEVLEGRVHALVQADRADVGVQVEPEAQAQVQVVADFGAVGVGHAGHARGAVQDGVGGLAGGVGVVGQHVPRFDVVVGAAVVAAECQQVGAAGFLQHRDRRLADFRADAIAIDGRDFILSHVWLSPEVKRGIGEPRRGRGRARRATSWWRCTWLP
nr:hypothetical protein [Achromobacter denitrificans]